MSARARLERGAEDEALEAVQSHLDDFTAAGLAARVGLTRAGLAIEAKSAIPQR